MYRSITNLASKRKTIQITGHIDAFHISQLISQRTYMLHLPCLFDCKFVSCNRCGSFVYDDFISVPTWFSPIIIACNDIEIESFDHFRLGCPTSSPYQYCISGVAHFTSFVKFKFMWSVSIIIDKCSKREHISFIESQTEYVQQCLSTHKKTV